MKTLFLSLIALAIMCLMGTTSTGPPTANVVCEARSKALLDNTKAEKFAIPIRMEVAITADAMDFTEMWTETTTWPPGHALAPPITASNDFSFTLQKNYAAPMLCDYWKTMANDDANHANRRNVGNDEKGLGVSDISDHFRSPT